LFHFPSPGDVLRRLGMQFEIERLASRHLCRRSAGDNSARHRFSSIIAHAIRLDAHKANIEFHSDGYGTIIPAMDEAMAMDNKQTGNIPGPGPGRPKGSPNKTTKILREAILEAAEQSGEDGQGRDGLVGYLRRVADTDIKAFSTLLGKVLPLQVTGEHGDLPVIPVINLTIGKEPAEAA
jgi:hypothetical protein